MLNLPSFLAIIIFTTTTCGDVTNGVRKGTLVSGCGIEVVADCTSDYFEADEEELDSSLSDARWELNLLSAMESEPAFRECQGRSQPGYAGSRPPPV